MLCPYSSFHAPSPCPCAAYRLPLLSPQPCMLQMVRSSHPESHRLSESVLVVNLGWHPSTRHVLSSLPGGLHHV